MSAFDSSEPVPNRLVGLVGRVGSRLWQAFVLPPPLGAQGLHLDPDTIAPPDPNTWTEDQRDAYFSPEMDVFRSCLTIDGKGPRDGVLDDLAVYYKLSPEECLKRCIDWERWSVEEWKASERSTDEGLKTFYDSVESWSFDLLWYAYVQAKGFGFPAALLAARFAKARCEGRKHLDLGSGAGTTSQLFHRLGFESTLGDVSKALLDFATFRLERRGDRLPTIHLTQASLPENAFDVVTAIDTLAHVKDFPETVRQLHAAIRPGGWLLANFDMRSEDDASAWHLQHDDLDLEYQLRRAGFVDHGRLGGTMICYQRYGREGASQKVRDLRDDLLFKGPGGSITRAARRVRLPTPARLGRAMGRVVQSIWKK